MLGCGYQFETIFPRDTQEAGEDQGKLIIPRSPLAFILAILVLILVTSNLNYRCCEWVFMGGQHRLCTKLDGQKGPLNAKGCPDAFVSAKADTFLESLFAFR
jgi:hypothetical protein